MEKTMRWWSDCTANWREKWCEVRDERNKIKKELKSLKNKLEIATKDVNCYKKESKDLELQNIELKSQVVRMEKIFTTLNSELQLKSALGVEDLLEFYNNTVSSKNDIDDSNKIISKTVVEDSDKELEDYVLQGAVPKHNNVESLKDSSTSPLIQDKKTFKTDIANEEALLQKMSMLNLRLEEATKTISVERE